MIAPSETLKGNVDQISLTCIQGQLHKRRTDPPCQRRCADRQDHHRLLKLQPEAEPDVQNSNALKVESITRYDEMRNAIPLLFNLNGTSLNCNYLQDVICPFKYQLIQFDC